MLYIYLTLIVVFWIIILNFLYYEIKEKYYLPVVLFPDKKNDLDFTSYEYGDHIPKVFHRTHLNQKIIDKFKNVEDKIKENNPDYEIINYTEEDIIEFIKEFYDERILKAYLSIKDNYGAAKADFFRYLVIYAKGGIYLDIKSGPTKNLDKLLKDGGNNILVSREHNIFSHFWYLHFPGEMIQWTVISPKGHPVMREIIEQCLSNIENDYGEKKNYTGARSVIFMSGPMLFAKVISRSKNKNIKYLSKNMNDHFAKILITYDKSKLVHLGAIIYGDQIDNIIDEYK